MSTPKTIRSCYEYPMRSFLRNKRAYVLLAVSILCMVILCASVLIYYASSYEAEVEMLRRENGPQDAQFYDVDPDSVSAYTDHSYIKKSLLVDLYACADNTDPLVSFSQVYFTGYTEEAADYFYVRLTEGRLPEQFGEIIVSEKAARYFSCFSLEEEQPVTVYVRGGYHTVTFRVVGIFKSATAAEQYVFASSDTAAYLKGEDVYRQQYTTDIYLNFKGNDRTAMKKNMQKLINDLGMVSTDKSGNVTEIGYEERNNMLSEAALVPPYYEGATMLLMFLFSILPAGIALTVFIYLDMQKNLRELAALSMIGATWKQIFRMQLIKYGAIFIAVFPFGIAGAAALMRFLCDMTNAISPDRVFLWFRFDIGAMLVLFLLSGAILCGVVYYISKKTTAVTYTEMLSSAHSANNLFVSRTSDILFSENRILDRIAVLFFTRNRGVNRLFCVVVILLVCIYSFFSQQITVEFREAPDNATIRFADYYLYGDSDASILYDTMMTDTQDAIEAIDHVTRVQRRMEITPFYTYLDNLLMEANIKKQLVNNTVINGKFGRGEAQRIWKRNVTDVRLIGLDSDWLHMLVGSDTVEGSLTSLYENPDTIALVVHGWAGNNEKYYHEGDVLALRTTWTETSSDDASGESTTQRTEWKDYTVGAVIYRPADDPYDDIITVYTSVELFETLSGIEDVYCYAVQCDSEKQEVLDAVSASLAGLESEHHFVVQDIHEQLREAKAEAMHTVFYIALMQVLVLIVAVLLLVAMAHFMLEVRAPSMRAMYLIGAQYTQIFRMNLVEFLISSALSSVLGILLAALLGLLNIGNLTGGLIALSFASLAILTTVNIFVPVFVCKQKLRKSVNS